MEFITAFNSIFMLLLIMSVGFLFKKRGILGDDASNVLSTVVVKVAMPALSFSVFSQNFSKETIVAYSADIIWGTVIVTISFLLSLAVANLFGKRGQLYDIIVYSVAIPNLGYIGYPMVEAVWGTTALFRMMMFCIPFNIAIYTVGMYILNPNRVFTFKKLLSPPMIGMLIGMVVGFFKIPVPSIVTNTVDTLKVCMAPLAMLLSGVVIARQPIKKLGSSFKTYILAVIKNLLMPLIIGVMLYVFGIRGDLFKIAVATIAMPMGLNAVVFPEAFGGDGTYGAQACFVSNVLALGSIPLAFYLINIFA